jgi:hypothetical protein
LLFSCKPWLRLIKQDHAQHEIITIGKHTWSRIACCVYVHAFSVSHVCARFYLLKYSSMLYVCMSLCVCVCARKRVRRWRYLSLRVRNMYTYIRTYIHWCRHQHTCTPRHCTPKGDDRAHKIASVWAWTWTYI